MCRRDRNESDAAAQPPMAPSSIDEIFDSLNDARDWTGSLVDRVNTFVNSSVPRLPGGVFTNFGSRDVAYPVPTTGEYDKCVGEKNGKSVWTEDGMWRCLYRGSTAYKDLDPESRQFTDYNGFLKYQQKLLNERKARAKLAEENAVINETDRRDAPFSRNGHWGGWRHRRSEPRDDFDSNYNTKSDELAFSQAQGTSSNDSEKPFFSFHFSRGDQFKNSQSGRLDQLDGPFPGSEQPRIISDEEAQGKKVVSSEYTYQAFTDENGKLQSRRRSIKKFDDNTATVSTTISNAEKQDPFEFGSASASSAAGSDSGFVGDVINSGDSKGKGGWFWK